MNRIDTLFKTKQTNILSVYFTAGFPNLDDTIKIILQLEKLGVDLIEIGMPYSDPLADGPVIQKSSHTAIENGMSLKKLFNQLKEIRKQTNIPLVLMGYLNTIINFGKENFCEHCDKVGIDGVILPDLPLFEYKKDYKKLFSKTKLYPIFLVTPETDEYRLKQIVKESKGFIYVVSSSTTTGNKLEFNHKQKEYFNRVKKATKKPLMVGFGINNKKTFNEVCNYANGAIVGTQYIKELSTENNIEKATQKFVKEFLL